MNKRQIGFILALFGFTLIVINALFYIFRPYQAKPSMLVFGILIYILGMLIFKKEKK